MKKLSSYQGILAGAALSLCVLAPGQLACSPASQSTQQPEVVIDRFGQMDANNDGKVVLEEFRAAFPNMNENAFVVIDRNGDKGIDRIEWTEFMKNHGKNSMPQRGAPMNNIPGDPLIPPPDSNDLPLVRPPMNP